MSTNRDSEPALIDFDSLLPADEAHVRRVLHKGANRVLVTAVEVPW